MEAELLSTRTARRRTEAKARPTLSTSFVKSPNRLSLFHKASVSAFEKPLDLLIHRLYRQKL